MLLSRWFLFLVYPHAVGGTECLVGCMVQGIDPFDDDNLAVWDDRSACDATTIGCTVDARSYPSTTSTFQGALWASTSGTDGSSSCVCDICDPYPYGGTEEYMEDETSLWNRIQCYIAAAEWAGYDVTPCVEAILNGDTLACVDDVYEAPTVPQFECEDNGMVEHPSYTVEVCVLSGTTREAQELFPTTSSSTSAASSVVADTHTCLVGCMVQGIDPFEDVDQAVWDSRGACDSTTIGCEVTTIIYPSYVFEGALWASSSGTDGVSGCTCNLCDPYPRGGATDYMPDEPLWSRIQCFLAASESSGYDVSPCVAAILDTGTLPCVDDVYAAPTVDLLQCEENNIADLEASSSVEQCDWTGEVREASEMFSATSGSSDTTTATSSVVVHTNSCLVGCLLQDISPFDEDNLAVWDNRGSCDSETIGCEVSAVSYPYTSYRGALWASSSGTEGSSDCVCSLCDPLPYSDGSTYMSGGAISLWSRILCYLVASEASGYDVSPCVAAILDTGTLPCVDDAYEVPTVDQFDCETNSIGDLDASSSVEECAWTGDVRLTDELFEAAILAPSTLPDPTPSPLPNPTLSPLPNPTSSPLPLPAPTQPILPNPTKAPAPAPTISGATIAPTSIATAPPSIPEDTLQPSIASPETPGPSPTGTVYPEPTPVAPSETSPPSGSAPPIEIESCAPGSTCSGNLCCHPEYNTCGRKYTFCQQREFLGEARCCSGANGYYSELNLCSEDSICDKPTGSSGDELLELWISIVGGSVAIFVAMWHGCKKCAGSRIAALRWLGF